MKIFIVEDDPVIASAVAEHIASWGCEPRIARNFQNIVQEFVEFDPQLVLLDVGLPFYNGYHWCSEIRRFSSVPIIFVSSASDNMNIVMAINMGADDFIAKPFDTAVLIAKVQALLRRSYAFAPAGPVLEHRGAKLCTDDQSLRVGAEKVELSRNEYRILLCLLEHKGAIVSRETLMEQLWQGEDFVDENTLNVNVGRLRKKLAAAGLDGFITTKFGVGYLVEDV